MFPGLEFGGYFTLTCSAWSPINLFFLTQMFIVQVYVFIWHNIICFEIIISVHRSTRWSLFGIRINEWMNEFFVLSIDCSENDDCEGKTLVTTPNPKLLLFLMFLTYDWCTFIFVLKRNPPIIFKIRLLRCTFPMKNVNFTIKQLTEQVTTQRDMYDL